MRRANQVLDKVIWEELYRTIEEAFCVIIFATGVYLLISYINSSSEYDPADLQNFLLLTFGCFGSFVFLIDLFFGNDKKKIMKRHIWLLITILSALGLVILLNMIMRGISFTNMVLLLPNLTDSVLILFLMIFTPTILLLYRYRVKNLKESQNQRNLREEE